MAHTPEQMIEAANRHTYLNKFLDAIAQATAAAVVVKHAGKEWVFATKMTSVGQVNKEALDEIRKLEIEFGLEPYVSKTVSKTDTKAAEKQHEEPNRTTASKSAPSVVTS